MTNTFERVLEDNKERIFRICRIYATPPIEAQDLFQEVVFQVWKSFPSFKNESSIDTWVYRIGLNVCLRSKMKLDKSNNKKVQLESIQFIHAETHTDDGNEEQYQTLRRCISTLGEADQSIIILYLEDLPYKEIATITGLTENHVAVKMKRIRKKLFECIRQKL